MSLMTKDSVVLEIAEATLVAHNAGIAAEEADEESHNAYGKLQTLVESYKAYKDSMSPTYRQLPFVESAKIIPFKLKLI